MLGPRCQISHAGFISALLAAQILRASLAWAGDPPTAQETLATPAAPGKTEGSQPPERPPAADGQDACLQDPPCRASYEQALQQYKAGQFDAALRSYQTAYARRPAPWLLLSIGRTYFRLGDAHNALLYYQKYQQAEAKADAELQQKLTRYVTEALLLVTAQKQKDESLARTRPEQQSAPLGTSAAPAPPDSAQVPVAPSATQAPSMPSPALAPAVPDPARGGVPRSASPALVAPSIPMGIEPRAQTTRVPTWRLGVGIASMGVGTVLAGLGGWALSINGTCLPEPPTSATECRKLYDTLIDGAVLVAAGGVLFAGGISLLAWPRHRNTIRPR